LAEDSEVPQPLQGCMAERNAADGGGPAAVRAEVLHPEQQGEQVADLLGQVGEALAIVVEGEPLAAPVTSGELGRGSGEQDDVLRAVRDLVRHCRLPPAWSRGSS